MILNKDGKGFDLLGMFASMMLIVASNAAAMPGVDWTEIHPSPTMEDLDGVTFGNNLTVAVGDNGTILTSQDGVDWIPAEDSGTNKALRGVAGSDALFVAAGNAGTIVISPDGVDWSWQDSKTHQKLRGVAWNGMRFVAVGNMGTIVTSQDGTEWIVRIDGSGNMTSEDLNGVTLGKDMNDDDLIVAVGKNGTVLTSVDGVAWTSHSFETHRDLEGVASNGTHFVAVGNEGTIFTSPDGMAWTLEGSVTGARFKGVTWGGTHFVAVGDTGVIFTSPDGLEWTSRDSGTDLDLEGVTWNGTHFVAVGAAGTILTRPGRGSDPVSGPDIVVIDAVAPVDDLQLPFGKVTVDFTSEKIVTVANAGNDILTIGPIALADTLVGPFKIIGDDCSGATLAPAHTCTLTVEFAPTDAGEFSDTFDIPSNDTDEDPMTVAVSGTGVEDSVPDITVTDDAGLLNDLKIPFGDVTVDLFRVRTVMIVNDGSAGLDIGTIVVGDPSGPFSIIDDLCSDQTLGSDDFCTLRVRFEPTATGSFTGSLGIPSNDPDEGTVTISVSGSGLSAVANNPPSAPQLLFPANGQTDVETNVTFRWLESSDPDGDDVTYTLSLCIKPDFTDSECGAPEVVSPFIVAAIGGSGAGLLLFGFVFMGGVEGRKKTGLLIATVITSGILMTACSDGNGRIVRAGAPAVVDHDVEGLAPGTTFHWKVTADDGKGGMMDSEIWSFTTAP